MKELKLTALLLITATIIVTIYTCRKQYYAEYDAVKAEFDKIDGIKILELTGTADVTLEDIYGTIELKNGNTIGFFSLDTADFTNSRSISLKHINNWNFNQTGCYGDNNWSGRSIRLGEKAEYEAIRKLNIRNIRDVIAHFDELNAIVNHIPVHPLFDTLQRNEEYIYVQRYSVQGNQDTTRLRWADCGER